MLIKKISTILVALIVIIAIPSITMFNDNKAQAYFYVALRYIGLMELGKLDANNKNINKTLNYAHKALTFNENHPQANYIYSHTLLKYYNNPKKALIHIKKALIAFPQSPRLNSIVSLIYLEINDKTNRKHSLIQKQNNPNLQNALIHANIALEYAREDNDRITYISQLSQVHYKLKNFSKLDTLFTNSLKDFPKSHVLHNNYAWFLLKESSFFNPHKALVHAKKAAELSSSLKPYILDTLATAYFKLGQVQKAIELEKEAYKLSSSKKDKELFLRKINKFKQSL